MWEIPLHFAGSLYYICLKIEIFINVYIHRLEQTGLAENL